ncbi:amino acid-binding protein [Nocardioides sp. YIM 152315]|uniref:amino acid-binding protein n=1 Tax=Nocardioides sp. YIM 152315 TaxID=3031760 RepID=UPI0023D9E6A4|nr:amino acid-binding protein [Nocardioides sp. YIM 152315]MDF1605314.1 amino acid-binding protein [Nocardioides sp. YIM 152315]
MPFLLRVELPDVPGSLGRLAATIGQAGGDIGAIEIVEKRHDGVAVDDVLLETAPGAMPDSIVSACNALDGVRVVWISRYAAGGNIFLDLEAVEELTADPDVALDRLIDLLPVTFRADWAARVSKVDGIVYTTAAAPRDLAWLPLDRAASVETDDENAIACAARLNKSEIVVIGRRGGPEFLASEIARLGHLVGLAMSIARAAAKADAH